MTNTEKAKRLAARIEGYPDRTLLTTDPAFNYISVVLDEEVVDVIADALHLTDRLPAMDGEDVVYVHLEGRVFEVSAAVASVLAAALENYTDEVAKEA